MQRRKFGREHKLETVKLVNERGVAVAQAAATASCLEKRGVSPASSSPG